jgi:protein-tyrosine phosphatase
MAKRAAGAAQVETRAHVVDFHNHVIPGVDDGARDVEESRAALTALYSSGVKSLIATPHVDASIWRRPERRAARMAELDLGWDALTKLGAAEFPAITLNRGAEVKLDVPEPDLSDARLRLAGGHFALVEFPYFTIPPRSTRVLAHLRESSWVPVIAHPERYTGIEQDSQIVPAWKSAGAFLQVNGPSLMGRYGPEARLAAIYMLENGWADFFSSDYHARGRTEILSYRDLLIEMGAEVQAELLMWINPMRLLNGEPPLPVPPVQSKRGLWDRISAVFR